jgi:hypothetical protein
MVARCFISALHLLQRRLETSVLVVAMSAPFPCIRDFYGRPKQRQARITAPRDSSLLDVAAQSYVINRTARQAWALDYKYNEQRQTNRNNPPWSARCPTKTKQKTGLFRLL